MEGKKVGETPRYMHKCTLQNFDEHEIEKISPVVQEVEIPQPWGVIYKGDSITKQFAHSVKELKELYGLYGQTSSVALAIMQPGAFHKPYIRHASNCTFAYNYYCMRVYKIVEGSFTCVRNKQLMHCYPATGYIVVREDDIFSFEAGPNCCVFGIIDFPAFSPGIDANEVI